MSASRKSLVAVFFTTLCYRLLFQLLNGFPLRSDFFQRTAVMKDIAAGEPYIQFLNPELFYRIGSVVFYLPVDPLWFFSVATIFIAALGITTVYYVTAEFFGQSPALYTAFALVVMSVAPFRSVYGWAINSYISAYIFLPLFLLTLFWWQRDDHPKHLLTGSVVLLLIGGFHHLVFVETVVLLGFTFLLVDRRVVAYAPAILLNVGLMWENYGQYLSSMAFSLTDSILDRVQSLLSPVQKPSPPPGGGPGTATPTDGGTATPPAEESPTPSQSGEGGPTTKFPDSALLNFLSLLATLNPFVILIGALGFAYGDDRSPVEFDTASRILLAWVLGQVGMLLFTHFVQPNGTERVMRHLFIPFAMVFGVGFEVVLAEVEQRVGSLSLPSKMTVRRILLAIVIILSVPMLVYQVAPLGAEGYVVQPDSEVREGAAQIGVDGTILAPPLTNELVNYYHDGPVVRTYPRDFDIPAREQQFQAKIWKWWDDPSNCEQIQSLGIDWVFIDKRDYFDQYWNNPDNVRVPQSFDEAYLETEFENSEMTLYEVTTCEGTKSKAST